MAVDPPTADQLSDLRLDLADTAEAGFSDAELERLWQRAGGNHEATLRLAIRQLLMQASRFHDYVLGQGASEMKPSQVYDHLKGMLQELRPGGAASGASGAGLASVQLGTATSTTAPGGWWVG